MRSIYNAHVVPTYILYTAHQPTQLEESGLLLSPNCHSDNTLLWRHKPECKPRGHILQAILGPLAKPDDKLHGVFAEVLDLHWRGKAQTLKHQMQTWGPSVGPEKAKKVQDMLDQWS